MDDRNEVLSSIHHSAGDILRWVLLIAMKSSFPVSRDRKSDIINAARRILELAERL